MGVIHYCLPWVLSFSHSHTAYIVINHHTIIHDTVKAENPDAAFGDIARLISEKFKSLPDKEKKIWEEKAAEDKERYQREMAEYKS